MGNTAPVGKILVVDDDATTRFLISEILLGYNVTIIEAENSVQAISLYKKHCGQFDLVLLDILLPGYNGITLLKQIHRINPLIPAIAISALDPAHIAKEYKPEGFTAFITKPFKIYEFIKIVATYIELPLSRIYWEKQKAGAQTPTYLN